MPREQKVLAACALRGNRQPPACRARCEGIFNSSARNIIDLEA